MSRQRKARPGKPSSTTKAVTKTGSSDGNKRVLRSIILKGTDNENDNDQSQEIDQVWSGINGVVEPPYPLLNLLMLRENSTELGQCVDAMVTNIDSFGYRLSEVKMKEEDREKNSDAILKEKSEISAFLNQVNFDENITKLRKETRKNIEDCGNAYWELIPYMGKNGISSINRLKPQHIRMTNLDKRSTDVDLLYYDEYTKQIESRKMKKKFRRFVQIVGNKKTYFKEYGDPRNISCEDGKVIAEKDLPEAKKKGILANAVTHFKIGSDRTPYGIPRYIGNLFSIYGSRAADEINFITFQNNNIPSMLVMVSNGQMTEDSISRIQEFIDTKIKGSNNRSSFLILEAEPADDTSLNPGTMKLETKDLTSAQTEDQLFQEYDKNNADKVRRCFRLPPILVGKADDYGKDTAQESRKFADEQIFSPEREDFDVFMNRLLVANFSMKFHTFKSNSANLTNSEDLVKVLSTGEKTGGVTPNLSREILGDVLNREVPRYENDDTPFDPNIPLSYSLVELSRVVGGNEQTGKIAPNQGQVPAEKAQKELKVEILEDLEKEIYGELFTGEGEDE